MPHLILESLVSLYEDLIARNLIARPGWLQTKIGYALCINKDGDLDRVQSLFVSDGEGKKEHPTTFNLPAPVKRNSVIISNFLWDNSKFLLGLDEDGVSEKTVERFEVAKKLHMELLKDVGGEVSEGIKNFFLKWDPYTAKEHPALKELYDEIIAGRNLLFCVNGTFAQDDEAVALAWQAHYDHNDGPRGICLVTGKEDYIEESHPLITGLPGTLPTGGSLVNFYERALCSYGKEKGFNAPIGKYAAFAYYAALKYLLSDPINRPIKLGNVSIVCWAEGAEPQYRDFANMAINGISSVGKKKEETENDEETSVEDEKTSAENDIHRIIRSLANGFPVEEKNLDPEKKFFVLGLSPNMGRISISFFWKGSFGSLMKNVNEHYERMEITRPAYEKREFVSLWALLQETVNKNAKNKDPIPTTAASTTRAIVEGTPYPASLLEQTMLRIRAEKEITRGRAAIIKAYFLRSPHKGCPKEVLTVALNEKSTNIPYNLGRLFAIYEEIQYFAIPSPNSPIKRRFFNAAAASPARVFPVLNHLSQKHLQKMSAGSRIYYENKVLALLGVLGDKFPTQLSLQEQGSFDLGYYHQTQKRYEKGEKKDDVQED